MGAYDWHPQSHIPNFQMSYYVHKKIDCQSEKYQMHKSQLFLGKKKQIIILDVYKLCAETAAQSFVLAAEIPTWFIFFRKIPL